MSVDRQPLVYSENDSTSVELKENLNTNTMAYPYPGVVTSGPMPMPPNNVGLKENINKDTMANSGVVTLAPMPLNKDGRFLVGASNTNTTCPYCAASINTAITYRTTTRTHFLALSCCPLCCCCLPYCMTSTRNTDHFCPNCKKYLGTYEK